MAKGGLHLLLLLVVIVWTAKQCDSYYCYSNTWGAWGRCNSNTCNYSGYKYRYRYSSCYYYSNYQSKACWPTCACSYNSWSNSYSCSTKCGYGRKFQTRNTRHYRYGCTNYLSRYISCYSGSCNCVLNNWGSWGSCSGSCGSSGSKYRYRYIRTSAVYPGTCTSNRYQKTSCTTGCCKRNCLQNSWSNWGSCSTSCGYGYQRRYRYTSRNAYCGGTNCANTYSSRYCYRYTNRNCQVNTWGSWGSCHISSGASCGSGYYYRYRYVRVNKLCNGASCPSLSSTRACSKCCPKSCVWNAWGTWNACSTSCGSGLRYRYRSVRTYQTCGGSCPGSSSSSAYCSNYVKRNCVVSSWGSYTPCTSQCGTGTRTRTRKVTSQATCGGSCPDSLVNTISCTQYIRKNCQVGQWGSWGSCSSKCKVGLQYSYRSISVPAVCGGTCIYANTLSRTKSCGAYNGGCQQTCNNGVCSCSAGYTLNADRKTCKARSCGTPTLTSYCPAGAQCVKPTYSCTGYVYPKTCTFSCPTLYAVMGGVNIITCQASGVWTDHSTAYCGLTNRAPTKITLSYAYVNEMSPRGTVIGALTTTDPNPSDTHTYSLTNSAGGKFYLSGSSLRLGFVPNYETGATSYTITVKSTDQGGLSCLDSFVIYIRDINEKPKSCQMVPSKVQENPSLDTVVGTLSTTDPDSRQTYTYTLLDSASSRFKLVGTSIKVALSNAKCLADGYGSCLYNYESTTLNKFSITVRSTDNGSPPLSVDCRLTVDITDVNDQPRKLLLSGYTLKEGASIGTQVGALSVSDEDSHQTITYNLVDDDSGRFSISQNRFIVNSKVANYETKTSHSITVRATDSGSPPKYVQKIFSVTVLDIKEAPVAITITSTGATQAFANNAPSINENSLKNSVVGTIVARDPDSSAKLTFSLDNSAGGRFALDRTSAHCFAITKTPGVLTECDVRVLVNGVLNHEVDSLHTIVVRVTDEHGLFTVQRFNVKIIDINDRPHDITTVGLVQCKENLNNLVVTSFQTSDEDPSHTHTYSLVTNPSNKFKIVGSRLMTTATSNLNYELQSSYTIVVLSKDNGSPAQYIQKTFVVTVLDVNEVPTSVTLSSNAIKENSALDAVVGQVSTSDPDNIKSIRQTFTYTLKDSAGGLFKLVGSKLQVAVPNVECLKYGGHYCQLNFEKAKTHKVDIEVTDNGSPPLSSSFLLTVNVQDVNDRPRDLDMNNTIVRENKPVGTLVGVFSSSDEDVTQSHTYRLLYDDNGQFKLNAAGTALVKAKKTNYETKKVHRVMVEVVDNGNPPLPMIKNFSISVVDVNEAPIQSVFLDTGGQQSFNPNHPTINENTNTGVVIGSVQATDSDANQQLAFTLDDDAGGLFAISPIAKCSFTKGSVCTSIVTVFHHLDHESGKREKIVVRVTDPGGHFVVTTFVITVLDVNDAPSNITLAGGKPVVAENRANALVGGFRTIDDDLSQTFTYTLLSDANGKFKLQYDLLYTVGALDFEQTPTLTIRVKVTDSGTPPLSREQNFVIKVINVNEKPTRVHISNSQIDENSPSNTLVGKLSTSDPDNTPANVRQAFTYTLLDTGSGRFKMDVNQIKVQPSNVACLAVGGTSCWLNYESKPFYTLLVRVTDSGSPPLSTDFYLNVTLKNVNDRPRQIKLSDFRLYENQPVGTVVGKFSGYDEDAHQQLTFVLDNDDKGRFKIVGNELQKAQQANYETQKGHTVVVTMKDDGTPSLNITETLTLEVLDVNEAPVSTDFLQDSGQLTFAKNAPEVEENSVVGTAVGTIFSIDQDYNQTSIFSLDDSAGGLFSLSSAVSCNTVTDIHGHHSSCQTLLLVAGHLDYETTKQHDIVVRITDQGGKFNVARFTIKIVDANDVPHDINIISRTVKENSPSVFISDFITLDADKTHTHNYSLVINPRNTFEIINNGLYSSKTAVLNYEAQQTWTIVIRSTDDGTPALFLDETFNIIVEDVNEVPSKINITGRKIRENSPVGTVVGELQITDPDNFGPKGRWQNASCIATDNADGIFTVFSNIVQVAQASINYEVNKTFAITVKCTDDGLPPLSLSLSFIITVLNVNEPPTNVSITSDQVREDVPAGTVVGTLHSSDPDNAENITQTFTYSFVHPPTGLPFTIVGNQLRTMKSLDYETVPAWPVVIQSTDSAGLSLVHTFQVNVIDVNEPATAFELLSATDVPENSLYGTLIGDVVAVDQDANQTHTFKVVGVALGVQVNSSAPDSSLVNAFKINSTSGELTVGNVTLNYEVTPHYTVWVETTDHGLLPNLRFVATIEVNISDINEAPTNIALDYDKVAENSPVGTIVGNLTVTDPDNMGNHAGSQTFNCSVVDAYAHSFMVVDGLVLVVSKDDLDFEGDPTHYIEIQCFDDDSVSPLYLDAQFNISLINVNEAPTMLKISNITIPENEGAGAEMGILSAIDPDNEVQQLQNITFEVILSNTTDVPFDLIDNNIVETTINFNYEERTSYVINFTATDTGIPPLTTEASVTVTVINENDPPTDIVLNSSGIPETAPIGTVIGTLATVDEDRAQWHTYRVLAFGNVSDSTMFTIRGNELLLQTPVDFETDDYYQVMIESTDSGTPPLSHQNLVHFNITNINEAPTEIDIDYNMTVKEHSPVGAFVANMTVLDPDTNQTHTCYLLNGQQEFMLVNATITGEEEITMEVTPHAVLDYETTPFIVVTINCSDDGNPPLSITKTIQVSLQDVNDPPTAVMLSGDHTIPENSELGYVVGDLSTVDHDKGQIYTYAVFGNGSDVFDVNEGHSQLLVGNKDFLDFEALNHPHITVLIEVSDNGNPPLAFNQTFNFTITNVNEPPSNVTLLPSLSFPEDLASGAIIGQLEALNPEENQTLTFAMIDIPHPVDGPTFGVFVNSTGSYLQLINNAKLSVYATNYDIQLNVSDDGSPMEWTIAILTLDVTRQDPCAVGTLKCTSNAKCRRVNTTTGACSCDFGYVLDPKTSSCTKVDNCHMPVPSDFMPEQSQQASQAVVMGSVLLMPVCANNGTCSDLGNDYRCSCGKRWTGPTCETYVSRCNTSLPVCQNGAECQDTGKKVVCVCTPGYRGDQCEVNINECENVTCGAGTCVDGIGNFTCICPEYLNGRECQYKKEACAGDPCGTALACVPRRISLTGEVPIEAPVVSIDGAPAGPFAPVDYYCIPPSDWTSIAFVNGTLTSEEKEMWKSLVLSTPYIGADGQYNYADEVYFEPDLPDGRVSYVVLHEDKVVRPPTVIASLKAKCKTPQLPPELSALCNRWAAIRSTDEPTTPGDGGGKTQGQKTLTSSSTLTWGIAAGLCFATLLVVAVVSTRFFFARKKIQERNLTQDGSAGFMNDRAAAEHASDSAVQDTYASPEASRQDSVFVRNPLYHNPHNNLYGTDNTATQGARDLRSPGYHNPGYGDPHDLAAGGTTRNTDEGDYAEVDRTGGYAEMDRTAVAEGPYDRPVYESNNTGYDESKPIPAKPNTSTSSQNGDEGIQGLVESIEWPDFN